MLGWVVAIVLIFLFQIFLIMMCKMCVIIFRLECWWRAVLLHTHAELWLRIMPGKLHVDMFSAIDYACVEHKTLSITMLDVIDLHHFILVNSEKVKNFHSVGKVLWCLTAYKPLRLSQIPIDAFVNQTVALKDSDKLSDDRPSMPLGPCAPSNDVSLLLFQRCFQS